MCWRLASNKTLCELEACCVSEIMLLVLDNMLDFKLPETPTEPSGLAEFSLLLRQTDWMTIVTQHKPRNSYYRIVQGVVDWCNNTLKSDTRFRWYSVMECLSYNYGNRWEDEQDKSKRFREYAPYLISFPTLCFGNSEDMIIFALNFPEHTLCKASQVHTRTFIELKLERIAYRSDPYPTDDFGNAHCCPSC